MPLNKLDPIHYAPPSQPGHVERIGKPDPAPSGPSRPQRRPKHHFIIERLSSHMACLFELEAFLDEMAGTPAAPVQTGGVAGDPSDPTAFPLAVFLEEVPATLDHMTERLQTCIDRLVNMTM